MTTYECSGGWFVYGAGEDEPERECQDAIAEIRSAPHTEACVRANGEMLDALSLLPPECRLPGDDTYRCSCWKRRWEPINGTPQADLATAREERQAVELADLERLRGAVNAACSCAEDPPRRPASRSKRCPACEVWHAMTGESDAATAPASAKEPATPDPGPVYRQLPGGQWESWRDGGWFASEGPGEEVERG